MFTSRKWWLLAIAALLPLSARADGLLSNKFTTAVPGTSINTIGTAIAFHKITWNVSGTASVCTVALDTSADGITWSAGGAIAGQTCTSNGSSTVATTVANFVRINMTALTVTAGSSVSVTWTGYVNNPAAGGAVGCTTTGGIAYENGTNNTLTCGSVLTWDPGTSTLSMTGNLNQTLGTLTIDGGDLVFTSGGTLIDSSGFAGTIGQSLLSTGTGVQWANLGGIVDASAPPYNVIGDGGIGGEATISNNSKIVTCMDCNFDSVTKPAVAGMQVRGFSCVGCSNGTQLIPNATTISSVDSNTQIHISNNATGSSTPNAGSLYWGTDWTTQLTAAFAAEHALQRCGTIRFPPGYILTKTSAYGAQNATCNFDSTNVDGAGEDIGGQGKDTTFFVILPDSGNTTFITNASAAGPTHLHDLHFYGGGWSAYNAHLVNLGQDSTVMNVKFSSIGAANNNQGTLYMGGTSSGWGSCINCYLEYTGGLEINAFTQGVTIVNGFWNTMLRIDTGTVNDYGSVPGQNQSGFNGLIDNSHGGTYRCFGTNASGANGVVSLRVGNASNTYLSGCSIGANTGTAYGIFFDSGGANVFSTNSSKISGGTNGALNNTSNVANSKFFDDGTTTFGGILTTFLGHTGSTYTYNAHTQANVSLTAQAGALSATTAFTTGGLTAFYRVHVSVECTTTSAAATVTPAILYTDTSNTVQTVTGTAATCTALGAASNTSQDVTFRALNATNIQYQTTIVNTPTYDINVAVEQLAIN